MINVLQFILSIPLRLLALAIIIIVGLIKLTLLIVELIVGLSLSLVNWVLGMMYIGVGFANDQLGKSSADNIVLNVWNPDGK